MRWMLLALVVLAGCLIGGCTSEDPNALEGTSLLQHRTNGSKALRADDDDDDDSATTTKTSHVSTATTTSDDSADSTGPVFVAPGDTPAQTPTTKTIEDQCFEIVNKYRATKNLAALARWTAEESCSDQESQNDSGSGAAHGSFGQCGEMAQNECPGYPGSAEQNLPECIADMWAEGPGGGHYENMTSTQYTQVACGVFAVSDGTFWAVQNFR